MLEKEESKLFGRLSVEMSNMTEIVKRKPRQMAARSSFLRHATPLIVSPRQYNGVNEEENRMIKKRFGGGDCYGE